ncbi:MAG: acyltransferase [Pseudomonadota bacterium]
MKSLDGFQNGLSERWWRPEALFEFGGGDRLLAMEGLRGVAVGLVFLQHYCAAFINLTGLDGPTRLVASAFKLFGNCGVELFFVLSGFLIYGMLLRRRPVFLDFMRRRAERLYPAFLVALAFGILLDPLRSVPKIPDGFSEAALYLGANLAFLPGLLPIEPLFAVNWSLSYEWWFYAACTVVVGSLGAGLLPRRTRVLGILALGCALVGAEAAGLAHVPIRGLCLLAGMLLAEAQAARIGDVSSKLALIGVVIAFGLLTSVSVPTWLSAVILATAFFLLTSAAFNENSAAAALLSVKPLRWLGNMSYSFYLLHGFVVINLGHIVLTRSGPLSPESLFWLGLLPTFGMCLVVSAGLFLLVEKPFSLRRAGKHPQPTTPDPRQSVG